MRDKLIAYGVLGFLIIVGWNIFLVQRDDRMFDAYEKKAAMQRLGNPPSNSLETWCKRQVGWHPDCNVE